MSEKDFTGQQPAISGWHQFLPFVLSRSPVALWATDASGVFTMALGKGLQVLGLKPEEAVGCSLFEVYADSPEVVEANRRALKGEEVTSTLEVRGHVFQCVLAPLWDSQSKIVGLVGVANDVTKRKQAEDELVRRNRMLSAVYAVDRATAETLELEVVLHRGLAAALSALQVEAGGIYLLEDDGQTLTLRITSGIELGLTQRLGKVKVGMGVSGMVVAQRKPVVVDVEEYPDPEGRSLLARAGVQTLVSAPLLTSSGPVGALTVVTTRVKAFPVADMELLTSLGLQLGGAVQRAQLYEAFQARAKELTALNSLFQQYLQQRDETLRVLREQGQLQGKLFAQLEEITARLQQSFQRQLEAFDRCS